MTTPRPTLLLALAVTACAGGSPRPPYPPVQGALERTLEDVFPYRVVEAALDVFSDKGYPVQTFSKDDGFLETRYVDVVTGRGGERIWDPPQHLAKFRLRADPSNGGSRVTLEVLFRPQPLPRETDRFAEEMVPETHPGYRDGIEVLDRIERELTDFGLRR